MDEQHLAGIMADYRATKDKLEKLEQELERTQRELEAHRRVTTELERLMVFAANAAPHRIEEKFREVLALATEARRAA